MNTYLPVWTDRYPEPEQHYDLGWISASCKDDPRYSLLPLRFYGRGHVFPDNFRKSYSVNNYYPQMSGWHWLITEIIPAQFYFAEMLYKKAAEQIFENHPDLSDISFSQITADGIYPIEWNVPYAVLLEELKNALKDIYESGFSVDEQITIEESFDWFRDEHKVNISGVLIGDSAEISEWYYRCNPENYSERKLRKKFRPTFEDCCSYYRIFTEEELTLGNQTRIYSINENRYTKEFAAAREGDFSLLLEYVSGGFDPNTMGICGETAFSMFFSRCEESHDFDKLDTLISLGANPALYGCEFDSSASPLWDAYYSYNISQIEYLLSKGVNPTINTSTGFEYGEFLIDRLERWYSDNDNDEETKHIIDIISKYLPSDVSLPEDN